MAETEVAYIERLVGIMALSVSFPVHRWCINYQKELIGFWSFSATLEVVGYLGRGDSVGWRCIDLVMTTIT